MVQGDSVVEQKKAGISSEEKEKELKKQDEENMQKRMKLGEHVEAESKDNEESLGKLDDSTRDLINRIAIGQEEVDESQAKPSAIAIQKPKSEQKLA